MATAVSAFKLAGKRTAYLFGYPKVVHHMHFSIAPSATVQIRLELAIGSRAIAVVQTVEVR